MKMVKLSEADTTSRSRRIGLSSPRLIVLPPGLWQWTIEVSVVGGCIRKHAVLTDAHRVLFGPIWWKYSIILIMGMFLRVRIRSGRAA